MKRLMIASGLVLLVGCVSGGEEGTEAPKQDTSTVLLERYQSQAALDSDLQAAARETVEAMLDTYLACSHYEIVIMDDMGTAEAAAEGDSSEETTYTDTNVQEAGVDEADMVKTDGDYLYVATRDGVTVFQVSPASAFGQVGFYAQPDIDEMYRQDGQLVVISSSTDSDDRPQTVVSVVVVSDPTSPQLVWEKS